MSDDWDDDARSRPRRHRAKKRERLSPEERTYRDARRRANARLGFYSHAIVYAAVFVLVLFVAGFRPAFIMGLAWGIGLVCHFFGALVAPDLRRRLIRREVSREVAETVPRERRSIEDKHARSLEQLSASIAHEIRNPITAAKSLVQQMGEDPAARDNVGYAKVALEELDRVERSISHLLKFAREEEVHVCDLRMVDVLDSALETFRDRMVRLGVHIEREIDTEGSMRGDPEKLRRVIINLLGNALDAFEGAGTRDPRLRILAGENLAGSELWVRVIDNGPGVDAESLNEIFSPFYTSKDSGTGLGLAISKKLVDAHGGSIEAHSRPGDGTEFVLTFPRQRVAGSV
ncbi:MAG: HAMP domain-containing histidine kinase [Deltaproteobacteria bacterium]|nr:HAMP domain-containing histidine kinase [Deltaproteobacteria bacterium]MBW2360585.1 HAMP domain-containing histidine kinase [Deltaproteobacteria bacterium]